MGDLDDYTELVELYRAEGRDGEIAYRPPTALGVTWWQATAIYLGPKVLDTLTGHALESALDNVVEVAKRWAQARHDDRDSHRPQTVTIYGPRGQRLKEVNVTEDGVHEVDLSRRPRKPRAD